MMPTKIGAYGSTAGYGAAAPVDPRPWYSVPLSEYFTGPTTNTAAQQAQYAPKGTSAVTPAANYTWAGDFVDEQRSYAYRVWTHNVYPVAFQIIQGPPGTSLGKWVKSTDSGTAWNAIRSMYQRVTPAKKQIPQQIVGTGQADKVSFLVICAMVSVSMVVLSGWSGQISLGHFAFAGIGAGFSPAARFRNAGISRSSPLLTSAITAD